jgi:hypothetical protein
MVMGAFGMMVPYNDFDTTIMRNTLSHILETGTGMRLGGGIIR